MPIVLAGWLFGACGTEQVASDQEGNASSQRTTGGSTMPSTDPSKEPLEDLTPLPTGKPGRTLTLSGTVEPGVEAGCHLLTAGGSTYQLIWGQGEIIDGQRVEVMGAVSEGLMTTCQQGIPFVVERLIPS